MRQSQKYPGVILAILILVATAAVAQPGTGPRGAGMMCMDRDDGPCAGQGRDFGLKMLDLSDEQQQAVDKILESGKTRAMESRKEMLRLRNELEGVMLADAPDAAKARKLIESMGKLRTETQVAHMQQRLEIRKLLTPEQRDRLIAGHGKSGGRHRSGPGARDCNGEGPHGHRDAGCKVR